MTDQLFKCFCDADNAEYLDKLFFNQIKERLLIRFGTEDGFDELRKSRYNYKDKCFEAYGMWYKRYILKGRLFRVFCEHVPKFGHKHSVIHKLPKTGGCVDSAYVGLFALLITYDINLFEEMMSASYWAKQKFDKLKDRVAQILRAETVQEADSSRWGPAVEALALNAEVSS